MELPKLDGDVDLDALDLEVLPWLMNFGESESTNNEEQEAQLSHSEEKPYTCDFCDRGFSHRDGLKKHRRIHTGEKPYECDFCHKRFAQSSTLGGHRTIPLRNGTAKIR